MKVRYAEVYLNIRTSEINSSFDYVIPEKFQSDIKIGSVVTVPFGKKILNGIVCKIKENSLFVSKEFGKVKEIIDIEDSSYYIDEQRIKFAYWISYYYVTSLGNAIKLFMPPGFSFKNAKKTPSFKKIKFYGLTSFNENIEKYLSSRASQKRIVDFLAKEKKSELSNLIAKTDSSILSIKKLLSMGYIYEEVLNVKRDFNYNKYASNYSIYDSKDISLTDSQKYCIESIGKYIKPQSNHNFLLEGVTGSGKTEVYISCVKKAMDENKTSIILTPEISLVPQLYSMFKRIFQADCCVYHSGMSESERYERWMDILTGKFKVIIGTRSALFTPFKNPGIIIIDEFHDTSYKENSGARYCTVNAALKFSKILNIPVVLGSATPSVNIKYKFENTLDSTILRLNEKIFKDSVVTKEIIDLKKINNFSEDNIITRKLYSEIYERIKNKEKVIIFINKRGYSKYVICSECGFIPKCKDCNLPYTYHSAENKLKCHHCGRDINFNNQCPSCKSKRLRMFGTGIQKVEEKLRQRFDGITIVRMDSDVTSKKKSHEKILNEFIKSEPAILIGTQMVSKGLDIKDVTLVGVINIDSMFSLPDYSINERVYQVLTQVAGRTGRGYKDGKVLIQTYETDSIIIKSFLKDNFELFYNEELKSRKVLKYPPYCNLINIVIAGNSQEKTKKQSYELFEAIKRLQDCTKCEILGPSPAPFAKINKNYRWHILIKSFNINKFISRFTKMFNEFKIEKSIRILIDVDPYWIL